MGLCFKNAPKLDSWRRAITDYQNCIKTIDDGEAETVEAEGPEIRKVKKDGQASADQKIKDMEDADRKAEEQEEEEKNKMNESMDKMRGIMNSLKEEMNKKNIQEEKDRQRALEERNRLIELQDFLHKNEDCLENAELDKMNKSEEDALDNIAKMDDQSTSDIALSFKSKVMSEADKERMITKFAEMDQLNAEKNMNEKLKKMMVQVTQGIEQVLDSNDCFSEELGTNTANSIQKVCGNIFGVQRPPKIQELLNCIEPTKFCTSCCDHYIGAAHEDNRLSCKRDCRDKLRGVGPQVLVPINRMLYKLKNSDDLKSEIQKRFVNIQTPAPPTESKKRRRRL